MSLAQIPITKFAGTNVQVVIDGDSLYDQSQKLFTLLSRDFIISPPCEQFDKSFNDGFDALKHFEILSRFEHRKISDHFNEQKSRRLANTLDIDGIDTDYMAKEAVQYIFSLTPAAVNQLNFFLSILSPRLRDYYDFIVTLQDFIDPKDDQSSKPTDTNHSVVNSLSHLGIVRFNDNSHVVELCDQWNSEDSVDYLISEISKFVII